MKTLLKTAPLRHAVWAVGVLLSGCAALQIDVDVYKGPLVHDEDTQVQQLASITMSGKSVMLLQRNRWLDEVAGADAKGWRGLTGGSKSPRARYIGSSEWGLLGLPACNQMTDEAKGGLCRNARLTNDMLSAYQDRSDGTLAPTLEALSKHYQDYKEARSAHKAAKTDANRTMALQESNDALRLAWIELVELLIQVEQPAPEPENAAVYRNTKRQAAETLALLTEPALLACVKDLKFVGDIGVALKWVNDNARKDSKEVAKRGSEKLALAFRTSNAADLNQLRKAADSTASPSDSACATPKVMLKIVSHRGVQREATSNTDVLDLDLREIDELVGALVHVGASGFDRGRPRWGLDRLADDASLDRFGDRKNGNDDIKSLADSRQAKQLHDSAVDLASRMQFLAINMRLVDASESAQRFKTTLETIANSLLVLAEDQRRQRQHRAQQKAMAHDEYAAAVEAFKIDPGLRFDQLSANISRRLAKVRSIEAKDTASAERKVALTSQQTNAQETLKTAEDAVKTRAEAARDLMALHATLKGSLPKAVPGAAKSAAKDSEGQWKADQSAIDKLLKADPAKTTVQALRDRLAGWLEKEIKETANAMNLGDARRLRLTASEHALKRFATEGVAEFSKADAQKKLHTEIEQAVAEAVSQITQEQATANKALEAKKTAGEALAALEATARLTLRNENEALPSNEIEAALRLVRGLRVTVLAEAGEAKSAHEVHTIRDLVNAKLEQSKAATPADKQGAHVAALALVNEWAATEPATIKLGEDRRSNAIQTLDRVEAHLSYARVEAARRGGAGGTAVQDATDALAALMQRRERMSYLRPASMYLRSALASTGQQANPALDWSNLLWSTFTRQFTHKLGDSKDTAAVRAELDKSFWQNVNKVHVSAGGDSNFAIAKDDVGNWYVKAMGADPAAMVKAAKGLALYNLGGRVDANFLRMDELRNKTNRDDDEKQELKDLQDRRNGASATAYGSTLRVFGDNHATTVKALLEEVRVKLEGGSLAADLGKHWDDIHADSDSTTAAASKAKRASLPSLALTAGDGSLARLHQEAQIAVADAAAGTAGTTPSGQLIKALGLLAQQRGLLKGQVAAAADLTSPELGNANDAVALVEPKAREIAKLQIDRKAEADKLPPLRAALSAAEGATGATEASKQPFRNDLNEQQKKVNDISERLGTLHGEWVTLQEKAKSANTALAKARELQARASAAVDTVWQQFIKDIATRHLRAVEEMETAARVVSQGVQSKPASP